ncbi:hypothetical protein F383_29436 [Gossypium arboreum]|uniref:Uncharacterized protein n=1 Tax=Gossypium arboreum TaxID=29729 RepID=A0A0B0MQK5_GOSAR|nr:hypothetical protein F383_29436 [Gossypium arboreum]
MECECLIAGQELECECLVVGQELEYKDG